MTNKKELDRQAVLFDFKNRIIALIDNGQELPETGIYDEPVRYFKANLKWTPIIFGWLAILQSVAGWRDAEDENYKGIQELLVFEEGIEPTMATQEDIAKGMYQAMNWLALQVATGQYANINLSTDIDGVVTIPPAGEGAGLPDDDTGTQWNETKAAKYGGIVSVGRAINEYIARLDALYGTDSTPDNTLADAQYTMKFLYIVDATLSDAAIDAYYLWRAVPNGQLGTLGTTTFYQHLYCNGYDFESIVQWIFDGLAITIAKEKIYIGLIEALGDAFYSDAYNAGVLVPSLEYVATPCEPVRTEEFTLDMSSSNFPQYTTNAIHKAGHRILIEVSGSFVDADVANTVQDFFYELNTVTNVKTYLNTYFQISHSGITEPSQANVPYEDSHSYAVTIDIATNAANAAIIFGRDNDSATIPNVTGILTFKVTDLGQYA